jgi:hypothetical protein
MCHTLRVTPADTNYDRNPVVHTEILLAWTVRGKFTNFDVTHQTLNSARYDRFQQYYLGRRIWQEPAKPMVVQRWAGVLGRDQHTVMLGTFQADPPKRNSDAFTGTYVEEIFKGKQLQRRIDYHCREAEEIEEDGSTAWKTR